MSELLGGGNFGVLTPVYFYALTANRRTTLGYAFFECQDGWLMGRISDPETNHATRGSLPVMVKKVTLKQSLC